MRRAERENIADTHDLSSRRGISGTVSASTPAFQMARSSNLVFNLSTCRRKCKRAAGDVDHEKIMGDIARKKKGTEERDILPTTHVRAVVSMSRKAPTELFLRENDSRERNNAAVSGLRKYMWNPILPAVESTMPRSRSRWSPASCMACWRFFLSSTRAFCGFGRKLQRARASRSEGLAKRELTVDGIAWLILTRILHARCAAQRLADKCFARLGP